MVDFYAVSFELICCQFQFQHFYLNQTILPRYQIFLHLFQVFPPIKVQCIVAYQYDTNSSVPARQT